MEMYAGSRTSRQAFPGRRVWISLLCPSLASLLTLLRYVLCVRVCTCVCACEMYTSLPEPGKAAYLAEVCIARTCTHTHTHTHTYMQLRKDAAEKGATVVCPKGNSENGWGHTLCFPSVIYPVTVCMHASIHVRVHTAMYFLVQIDMYTHIHVYTYTCIHYQPEIKV